MVGLELHYDPEVDSYGSRILVIKSGQRITYEEALQNASYVEKALQIGAKDVPMEFTMFVLRKMAVREKDFRSFKEALPSAAREYLLKLFGNRSSNVSVVHPMNNEETPNCFRGAFTQVFCKKVISNNTHDQEDEHYDTLAAVFPFKVSSHVRWSKMKILDKFKRKFYNEVQFFLNRHFEKVDARSITEFFLLNIRNFRSNYFSAASLLTRLENPDGQHGDYLSTFPRLHAGGIEWFQFLYNEFVGAMRSYGIYVSEFYSNCDEEYFRRLPEKNFADLYSFFDVEFFENNRSIYMRRFRKYLFFFVHALAVDSNPVFFIDDLLFECMKSLRRYKTVEEDVSMKHDLVRIAMLHFRMKLFGRSPSEGNFYLNDDALKRMKKYLLERIIPENPRLNVKYKRELLAWMPFRTDDACLNVCYNRRNRIGNLLDRLLCGVLCPQNEPINCIITYNAFEGIEYRLDLPENMEFLRNFIRLCNTCDVTDEPLEPSHDEYILKIFLPFIENERLRDPVKNKYAHLIFICAGIIFVIFFIF